MILIVRGTAGFHHEASMLHYLLANLFKMLCRCTLPWADDPDEAEYERYVNILPCKLSNNAQPGYYNVSTTIGVPLTAGMALSSAHVSAVICSVCLQV